MTTTSPPIKQRILDFLAAKPAENTFLRSEFNALAESRSGIDKALRSLIQEGVLVRGGYGVVVRAKKGVIDGKPYTRPIVRADIFVREALEKMGIPYGPTQVVKDYMAGKTTQMQANLVLNVGDSRVRRKIGWGPRVLRYEYENVIRRIRKGNRKIRGIRPTAP